MGFQNQAIVPEAIPQSMALWGSRRLQMRIALLVGSLPLPLRLSCCSLVTMGALMLIPTCAILCTPLFLGTVPEAWMLSILQLAFVFSFPIRTWQPGLGL